MRGPQRGQKKKAGPTVTPRTVTNREVSTPGWLRRTLLVSYAFMGMWLLTGLSYVYVAALEGDVLRAVITAGITIAGSGAVLAMLTLLRTGVLLVHNAAMLETVYERLIALEDRIVGFAEGDPPQEDEPGEVNLSQMGRGDPEPLVATSLATDTFPRLAAGVADNAAHADRRKQQGVGTAFSPAVKALETETTRVAPPAGIDGSPEDEDAAGGPGEPAVERREPRATAPPMTAEERLLEDEWMGAFERADLLACRRILARANATLPPQRRDAMEKWLTSALSHRKSELRENFASLVRDGRYAEALATGAEIVELFPDTEIAAEFERIEPHLKARVEHESTTSRASAV